MTKVTLVIALDHDYVIPDGAPFDPVGQYTLVDIGDARDVFMTVVGEVIEYKKEEQKNG